MTEDIITPLKYPQNNYTKPNRAAKPNRVETVTQQPVHVRSEVSVKTFLQDSLGSVAQYVFTDVLIPAAKDAINDMVTRGIEMLLYGDAQRGNPRNPRKSYISYSSMFETSPRNRLRSNRSKRLNFSNMIFHSRQDAESVLSALDQLISEYGMATVADFYDSVGLETEWTDHKWGWDSLANAKLVRSRSGYALNLPSPFPIE